MKQFKNSTIESGPSTGVAEELRYYNYGACQTIEQQLKFTFIDRSLQN